MAQISDFLKPQDLSRISNLQVLARMVVEGFCTGLHRSPHRGFSVEFKQHRQYVRGDELKYLDWKVFGKTDRFYIREYEQETNLRCTILLDSSGSMRYGGEAAGGVTKHDYAVRLAASLAYLLLQQSDSVGLITFDRAVRHVIPARSRPAHFKILLDSLAEEKPGGETALHAVFNEIMPKLRRRGLIVILSDCFDEAEALLRSLAHFRHARHDVMLFQIMDPDELTFPFRRWTRFDNLEVPGDKRMVDPLHLREAYLANLNRFRETLKKGCYRHRIDAVEMTTDRPYAEALAYYLAMRRRSIL